jgi:hemerythrin
MKIVWSSRYELGIEVIDNQHKRIVEYINLIHDLSESDTSKGTLDEVLHSLVDYTYSHFAFEEALMEEAGYPDIAEHQLTHQTFSRQIETLRQRFDQGEQVASDLAQMLQHWLLNHILADDTSYSRSIKENILGAGADKHHAWAEKAARRYFNA